MAISFLTPQNAEAAAAYIGSQQYRHHSPFPTGNIAIAVSGLGHATEHRTIIVTLALDGNNPGGSASCSDNASGVYTKDLEVRNGQTNSLLVICSRELVAAATAPTSITVSHTNAYDRVVTVHEFSGLLSAPAADKTASAVGTNNTPSSGTTATTTQADELLIGAIAVPGTAAQVTDDANAVFTGSHKYSYDSYNMTINMQYGNVSSTGTYTYAPTLSGNPAWSAGIVTYKAAAAAGIDISGTCKQQDETTDCSDTGTIRVAVNGVLQAQTQTTVAGTWTISGVTQPSSGDVVTVYIEGAADTSEAVAVTKYDGSGNITGIKLMEEHLNIGSDDNQTVTNANLSQYDYSASGNKEDIFIEVDGANDLTIDNLANMTNEELYIKAGNTYRPDSASSGNVDSKHIEIVGTMTADGNTITANGDWDSSAGIFSGGSSTLVMTGANNNLTANGNTLRHLSIDAGATITAQSSFYILSASNLTISGTFNVAAGQWVGMLNPNTFTINAGGELGGAGTFVQRVGSSPSAHTFDGTISVATYKYNILNNAATPPGHILTGATYGGDLKIISSGNTALNYVYISGGDLNVGGTLTIATDLGWFGPITTILNNAQENRNVTAGNLVVGNAGATDEYGQLIAGSGTFDINGDVTIYPSDASGVNKIDADTSTWTVSGHWTNNDIFTADTSSITFDGSTSIILDSGGSAFNNLATNKTDAADANDNITVQTNDLTVNGTLIITDGELVQQRSITTGTVTLSDASSKWTNVTDNANVTLSGTVSNTGTITFDAPTGDLIQIRSSVGGTQRNWQGSGTFIMTDIDVQDQTAIGGTPANVVVTSGTNTGNNINWFFGGTNTIGGTVYTDNNESVTLNNKAVKVVIYDGALQTSYTTTTNGSGVYSVANVVLADTDIVTLYLDNEAEEGTTVFKSDGNNVANLNLYRNHVSIRSDSGAISNVEIGTTDDGDDDVKYSVAGNDITIDSNFELYIFNGSNYTPGGNVTTQGATGDVNIRGTVLPGSNTFTVSGDWDSSNGTWWSQTSTVNLTGTGTVAQSIGTPWSHGFYNATLAAAGQTTTLTSSNLWVSYLTTESGTFTDAANAYAVILQGNGNVFTDGGAALTFNSLTYRVGNNTQNVVGRDYTGINSLNFNTVGGASGSGVYEMQGNIIANDMEIRINNSPGNTRNSILNTNNFDLTATSLAVGTNGGTDDYVVLNTGSSAVDINGNVVIYASDANGDNVINAGSSTWSIAGTLTNSDIANAGSSTITLEGTGTPFVNSGTFNAGTSTITYSGTGAPTNVTTLPYHNLQFTSTAATTYSLTGNLTGANAMTGDLAVNTDATLDATAANNYGLSAVNVTITGTYDAQASTINASGNWDSSAGTFNYNTSTVVMTGAANDMTAPAGNQFYNLTINSGAIITSQSSFGTAIGGTLMISGTFNVTAGNTFYTQNNLTMNDNSTLSGAGTFRQAVRNIYIGNTYGVNTAISVGTYHFYANAATYVLPGKPIQGRVFDGNLLIDSSSMLSDTFFYLSNGDLTVNGGLTIAGGASGIRTVFDNSVENRNITASNLIIGENGSPDNYTEVMTGSGNIDINGDLTIHTSDGSGDNILTAGSSTWNVSGNWTDNDIFVPGTSTVTFDGITSTVIDSGGDAFNNLAINKTDAADANDNVTIQINDLAVNGTLTITDGELIQQRSMSTGAVSLSDASSKWTNLTDNANVTLSGTVSNTGTITFDAPTGDLIQIRSSVGGTQRNWQGSGTFSMTDVDVQDQTAIGGTPANITVTSGTNSGNNINWLFGTNTVGGTVYTDDDEATTLNSKSVKVVVYDGASQTSYTTTTNGSGVYSATGVTLASGNIVQVYLNDETEEGLAVLESDGANVADLNVYQNHVGVRSQVGVVSNADMNNVDDGDDDVKFNVSGSDITLDSGYELFIFSSSSYTPGGNVTTQGATGNVDIRGTITPEANTLTVSGDWDSTGGTATFGSSTLIMTGASKTFQTKNAERPWNMTIGDGVSAASVSHTIPNWQNGVANDLVISNNATFSVSGLYYYMPKTGDITLGASATLDITGIMTRIIDDSSSHISTAGTISGTGTFQYNIAAGNTSAPVTARTYDVDLSVSGGAADVAVLGGGASLNLGTNYLRLYDVNTNNGTYGTLDNSGNIPITAAELHVATSQGTGNLPSKSGKLICRAATYTFTNVIVYSSITAAPTIDCATGGGSSTWNVSGDVTIDGSRTYDGTLTAGSSTWNVGGDWNNDGGTFTAGTSSVVLNGTSQAVNGSTTFNNLTKSVASADTLTFEAGQTTTIATGGTVTLNGASGQLLTLASSTGSSAWNFTLNSGVTKAIDYVSVSWSDASGSDATLKPIAPANSTNDGDNVDWFGDPVITVTKLSAVVSDPINGASNPKRIPGAIVNYMIASSNSGDASPDANSTVVTDALDSTNVSYDVTTGVSFTDGATSSGLALGSVTFSSTAAPGPYVYDYTPSGGYDDSVTSIKVTTTGVFAHGGAPVPSFSIEYRIQVK